MKTVIYLDTLLLVNFIIGYLLLRAAGFLAGQSPGWGRCLLGGAAAACSTLVLLAPELPFWGQLIYRGATALAVVACAFAWRGLRPFLRQGVLYFFLNLLLAGVVVLWCSRGGAGLWQTNNLAVYAALPPGLLMACVAGVYLTARVFQSLFGGTGISLCRLSFVYGGRQVRGLAALYDTGFDVRDPYTGKPALLAALPALRKDLPPLLCSQAEEWARGRGLPPEGARLVACKTAVGGGLLPAVTVEQLCLEGPGIRLQAPAATLLLAGDTLADGRFDAVFGSGLFGPL